MSASGQWSPHNRLWMAFFSFRARAIQAGIQESHDTIQSNWSPVTQRQPFLQRGVLRNQDTENDGRPRHSAMCWEENSYAPVQWPVYRPVGPSERRPAGAVSTYMSATSSVFSAFFLAEISVSSPRKLVIFIT